MLHALSRPGVLFAVARDRNGQAVGCGAIVIEDGFGEIKRMYTDPRVRGRGVGRRLLDSLEAEARARGCREFALETGYLQAQALLLYARSGYQRCGPFGAYAESPDSVFMRKRA